MRWRGKIAWHGGTSAEIPNIFHRARDGPFARQNSQQKSFPAPLSLSLSLFQRRQISSEVKASKLFSKFTILFRFFFILVYRVVNFQSGMVYLTGAPNDSQPPILYRSTPADRKVFDKNEKDDGRQTANTWTVKCFSVSTICDFPLRENWKITKITRIAEITKIRKIAKIAKITKNTKITKIIKINTILENH